MAGIDLLRSVVQVFKVRIGDGCQSQSPIFDKRYRLSSKFVTFPRDVRVRIDVLVSRLNVFDHR